MNRWASFAVIASILFAPKICQSEKSCVIYGINEQGYQTQCRDGDFRSAVGSSLATFGDAFKINPAALPVEPSPFGVEIIGSTQGASTKGSDFQVNIIRGFRDFGFGVSSDPGNSFYAAYPTIGSTTTTTTTTTTSATSTTTTITTASLGTINIGGATAKLFKSEEHSWFSPVVGAAMVLDSNTQKKGFRGGLSLSGAHANLGVSFEFNPSTQSQNSVVSAGFSSGPLDLDLTYRVLYVDAYSPKTTQLISTLALQLGRLQANLGYRADQKYYINGVTWMAAVNCKIMDRARVAYLYNYRANSHSLGLQVLLF